MKLNREITGDASKPALLLIHPLGADLRFWDACIAGWREGFRSIACDLPSAGGSPAPDVPSTVVDQADALIEMLDDIGVERVSVIGTAVGGMPAIAIAARVPQRVSALIVTNPGIFITPSARAALADRIETLEAGGMPAILPGAIDKPFDGLPRDERYHSYLEHFACQDPRRYAQAIRGVLNADIRHYLPSIVCPTLVVCGEHEALMDPTHAEALASAVSGARKMTLEGAAHFLPYQAPRRFAELVRAFLLENEVST